MVNKFVYAIKQHPDLVFRLEEVNQIAKNQDTVYNYFEPEYTLRSISEINPSKIASITLNSVESLGSIELESMNYIQDINQVVAINKEGIIILKINKEFLTKEMIRLTEEQIKTVEVLYGV